MRKLGGRSASSTSTSKRGIFPLGFQNLGETSLGALIIDPIILWRRAICGTEKGSHLEEFISLKNSLDFSSGYYSTLANSPHPRAPFNFF